MFVTTSYHADAAMKEEAKRLSVRFGCRYLERGQSSIPRLRKRYGAEPCLIVGETGLRYSPVGADELFFHPSTALIRIKRLLQGENDLLLDLAQIRPGDHILDCTAGLGSDAIVFAYGAGQTGRVTAIESEPMLAFVVQEGLRTHETGTPEADAAMRRVELLHDDHARFLSNQPDASFDIVYFDPMFRKPIDDSSSISPLREVANPNALSERAIAEARRVARRMVILKENRDSPEFARLGFRKLGRSHTKVAYGVMELDNA